MEKRKEKKTTSGECLKRERESRLCRRCHKVATSGVRLVDSV